jgi:hypothetical protein
LQYIISVFFLKKILTLLSVYKVGPGTFGLKTNLILRCIHMGERDFTVQDASVNPAPRLKIPKLASPEIPLKFT